MEQATTSTTNFFPETLSPEFSNWLDNEKTEARRYRQRLLKATVLVVIGSALFLLKGQADFVRQMLDITPFIANPR